MSSGLNARQITFKAANVPQQLMIPVFLMSSYLYYVKDISAIQDFEFDLLCKRMLDEWDALEHQHKRLISPADLQAGSGYAIPKRKYPQQVIGGAYSWMKHEFGIDVNSIGCEK